VDAKADANGNAEVTAGQQAMEPHAVTC
jgi:hypothetical protein